jgi:hypothetical protein
MPKVGGKSYPYTKAGYKAAAKARKRGTKAKSASRSTTKMRRSY